MGQKLILVVDDNEDNRIVLTILLEHAGYAVLQAADGAEGVRQAQQHRPDLILLDLAMPVMDGWEALRRLRGDPSTAAIPVVAVTAQDAAPHDLREAGFCAYLPKPLGARKLLAAVEKCLPPEGDGRQWLDASKLDPGRPAPIA